MGNTMWLNFFRASSISRHILSVTDSTSVGPPLEVAMAPDDCWRKSYKTDASRTGTSSDSVKGSNTLMVGVGGISDTDDVEERDVDGETYLERLLDLPQATGTKGLSASASKSPLLPSSGSSSESSTASINKSAFARWTALRPSHLAVDIELRSCDENKL